MREARNGFEWTDTTLDRLRALWADGHSTAEIGRRMSISKNAVVGKAHRMNLAARPSPIRSADPSAPKRAPARRPVPKLADIMPITSTLPVAALTVLHTSPVPSPPAIAAPAIMTNHALPPARAGRTHSCCWPIGDPGTRAFRFCEADAPLGKSYCTEHAAIAYAKVRHRASEADHQPDFEASHRRARAQLGTTPRQSLRGGPDGMAVP